MIGPTCRLLIVGMGMICLCRGFVSTVHGDVPRVVSKAQDPSVWKGERARFTVELRAEGPFVGAASFSIPQIPRSVIVKTGNPVVSSKEIDGESWLIQTHEFALFSQQTGTVTIPSFEVRFGNKEGFTGPEKDHTENVPTLKFEIKAPPKSRDDDFLVTVKQIEISETWDPEPKPASVGNIFRRTITQHADQMTGMALAAPPTKTPDGIQGYVGRPDVHDETERGEFSGTRTDVITYQMKQGGSWTIPAIKYVWWDAETEQYGSKTLPAVKFEVAAPAPQLETQPAEQNGPWRLLALGTVVLVAVLGWQRHRLAEWGRRAWRRWNPPERVAARKLLKACQQNDAKAAETAWLDWQNQRSRTGPLNATLQTATSELNSHLYGKQVTDSWQGQQLKQAFRDQLKMEKNSSINRSVDLPCLNPH
ncbi:BatD family protein [Thalassoroseus pseudoceratinae]|uniref:BatD family protein n=1 Tax=Thalassoroseus pseudoceratinae TaxID=2713176 RepID=UPI00141F6D9A|nr:BatD family protein [Thalassoroseus pseudoceratinae]